MFIQVDNESIVEGWSYTNEDGEMEYVKLRLDDGLVEVGHPADHAFIYVNDIHKLIKALQKAEQHLEENL